MILRERRESKEKDVCLDDLYPQHLTNLQLSTFLFKQSDMKPP
jgi:hypothetical protein